MKTNQLFSSSARHRFLLLMLLTLFAYTCAWATDPAVDDVIFQETFGAYGANQSDFSKCSALADYGKTGTTCWVSGDKSGVSFSTDGNAKCTTSSGTNCTSGHVWVVKNTTGYFIISGIPLYTANGVKKVKITWSQGGGSKMTCAYAFDGGSTYNDYGNTSSAGATVPASPASLDVSGHTTIALKFYRTSTNTNIRIDNIKITVTEIAEDDCTELEMSDVTAVPGDRQIALSWAPVDHADSYTVTCVRKSDEATAGTVGSVTGTTTKTCTITGLTNDVEYTWSVKPVGSGDYCAVNTPASGDVYAGIYYDVTWYNNNGIYKTTSVRSGQKPTFPDAPTSCDDDIDVFYGWATAGWIGSTDDISEKTIYTKAYKMPAVTEAVSYHAVFTDAEYSYDLVESNPGAANWAGDYLIANASTIFADGRIGGTGTGGMGADGTKVNPSTNLSGKVVAASWGNTYCVELEKLSAESNTYLMITQDGLYNYTTSNTTGLSSTANRATAASHAITITYNSSSDIDLDIGGAQFHYNSGSGSGYFRFYKDGAQGSVYLYKKTASGTPNYLTSCCSANAITLASSGSVTGGTFEADPTSACSGMTVSISAEPTTGYTFGSWSIYKTGTPGTTVSPADATSASTTFTMPSYAVTVSATFNERTSYSVTWKVDGTTWSGKGGTSSVYEGDKVSTLPTAPDVEDFCGDEFMGWTDVENYVHGTSPLYKSASSFPNATGNQTFYAVFADYDD